MRPPGLGGQAFRSRHASCLADFDETPDQPVLATLMEDHGLFFPIDRILGIVEIARKGFIGLLDGVLEIRRHQFESVEQTPMPFLFHLLEFLENAPNRSFKDACAIEEVVSRSEPAGEVWVGRVGRGGRPPLPVLESMRGGVNAKKSHARKGEGPRAPNHLAAGGPFAYGPVKISTEMELHNQPGRLN